jgi:site-specific recombinase XerD
MPFATTPISKSSVQTAFRKALKSAGINKKATVHTLRHYAEFRIMPSLLGASMK